MGCPPPHAPPPPQVHLAMVRYHEGGRFCEKDEDWDQESAMFHLETAAMCGELEAIVAIGQCYLQLPHHVLPEVQVEVSAAPPPPPPPSSSLLYLFFQFRFHDVLRRITLETG